MEDVKVKTGFGGICELQSPVIPSHDNHQLLIRSFSDSLLLWPDMPSNARRVHRLQADTPAPIYSE